MSKAAAAFLNFIASISLSIKMKFEVPMFMVTSNEKGDMVLYRAAGVSEQECIDIMGSFVNKSRIKIISVDGDKKNG